MPNDLIDLRQLRAFQALAETRGFTAAAQRLFITQSAVSHSIKALETSLGCRLFDRTGKQAGLTHQGRTLLKHAERIFRELDLACEELSRLTSWGYGKLRIGAVTTMCQHLLPSVLREFRESFSNCDIRIHPGDTGEILDRLEAGDIDMAVGLDTGRRGGFECRLLFADELAFLMAPAHAWARKPELRRGDLEAERFIVYSRSSHTNRLVERYFDRLGVMMRPTLELGNMEAIKELVRIGLGVGIAAPWIAAEEIANQTLFARPCQGDPPLTRQWALFLPRGHQPSLAEETFAGICETVAHTFVMDRAAESTPAC
ncbi:MAG TPA: LysR family transcriptional regulator [Verrucomicrobiales bacterium]|nr:LysR family transcriptional regulator [Verrucomicrobiales bacterium]